MSRRDHDDFDPIDPGAMSPPDWDRVRVTSDQKPGPPLGTPLRWGASVAMPVSSDAGIFFQESPQIIQVDCADPYPRAWTVLGSIQADSDLWAYGQGAFINSYQPMLEVTMGVGQARVVHNFNLRAIIDADAPFYFQGQGGASFFGSGRQLSKPFLIPGAVVGQSISMRVAHLLQNLAPVVPAFNPAIMSVILTPFQPGSGL